MPEKKNAVLDFGGGFVADFSDFVEGDPLAAEETQEGEPNVAIEGEKTIPEGEEEKPLEKSAKEEEKPPEEGKEQEPPPVDPYEFMLKFRGKEETAKLTKEQITGRLQLLKSYQENEKEFWENAEKFQAYRKIIEAPWFQEVVKEKVQSGEAEITPVVPEAKPEDVIGYQLRINEPDFAKVTEAMQEWVVTLPYDQQILVRKSHGIFNQTYDRFKSILQQQSAPAAPTAPNPAAASNTQASTVDPKTAKAILETKEIRKAQAAVEQPGMASPDVDAEVKLRKQLTLLKKGMKEGKPGAAERLAFYHLNGSLPDW